MQKFGWSPFVLLFPSPLVPLLIIWWLYKSTKYNWYKRHFHLPQFPYFPSKVRVFIFLFTFFQFYSVVSWNSKVHNFASSLFLFIIIRFGRLAEIKWSIFMSKSQGSVCVSLSWTDAGFCGAPTIMTFRPIVWIPGWITFWLVMFFMGNILWL